MKRKNSKEQGTRNRILKGLLKLPSLPVSRASGTSLPAKASCSTRQEFSHSESCRSLVYNLPEALSMNDHLVAVA